MKSNTSWFLLALGCYVLTAGLSVPFLTISNPDEPRFACAARTMLRTGDYIVPKFNGKKRDEKPILFYWVLVAAAKVGQAAGLALEIAMRLGPLFMGGLAVAGTFALAQFLNGGSGRAGFVAAAVVMSCNLFHKISTEIVIDMTLTAFLTWAWYFLLKFLERWGRHSCLPGTHSADKNVCPTLLLLGFYLSLGLACMTKGPLPLAGFVVLPALVYLIWTHQLKRLKAAGLWWGIPLAAALGFWWFFAIGSDSAGKFFWVENFKRIFGAKDHIHEIPYAWYLGVLGEVLAPWIILLPFMLWQCVRLEGFSWVYVVCGLGVAFGVIGLSASKRQLYLLPLLPHFAVWVALWFESIAELRGARKAVSVLMAAALIFALVDATILTQMREKTEDRVAFFDAIGKQLAGRRVATLGESANEAVWFLDRKEPILNLTRPKLKDEFFDTPGTVLLLKAPKPDKKSGQLSDKEALTLAALNIEFERKRGPDTYYLATPKPNHTPDPSIFIGRGQDPGED